MKKLHVERQGDSGLAISGIFVWGNCYIILLVMSAFFIIVGIILSIISYASEPSHMSKEEQAKREDGTPEKPAYEKKDVSVWQPFLLNNYQP